MRFHFHNKNNRNAKNLFVNKDSVIDVSEYADMQELMAASDIGITDYSSWIFDFMLTRRPAFIYAEDINKYIHSRGFYYSIQETPFLIADSNEALNHNIINFDEKTYLRKVDLFLKERGCYETGNASERLTEFIIENT
ncbi:MAG: CDP-glycerol glycerophosphotransferase family protein [Clostridium sp.]|nr:CDP-glycerol glycerophosphotransferase family protein [Clostridium sp.]